MDFDDLKAMLVGLFMLASIGLTFGTWKIIEIIVWIFRHVNVVISQMIIIKSVGLHFDDFQYSMAEC